MRFRAKNVIFLLLSDICLYGSRFLGTPFFHSMMARTWSFSPDISVLVDPETIVLPDLISTLKYAYKLDHDWLLVASSRNVSYFPFYLDEDGRHWRKEDGKLMKTHEV